MGPHESFQGVPSTVGEQEQRAVEGLLFVAKDGFGFLRQRKNNYLSGSGDPFVPAGLVKRNRLKVGQFVEARIARGGRNKRKRPVDRIVSVDGDPPEVAKRRPAKAELRQHDIRTAKLASLKWIHGESPSVGLDLAVLSTARRFWYARLPRRAAFLA